MLESGEITELLRQADLGVKGAADRLFVLVQKDLEAVARKCKRAAAVGDEVETLMLVDDAFVRLVGNGQTTWEPGDRKKFFGYMARRIHDLLIDALREERAAKRGGKHQRVEFSEMEDPRRADNLELELDLREALTEFQQFARDEAIVFRLRHLTGCTFKDIADIMGMPETSVQRAYRKARRWLSDKLKEACDDS